MIFDLDGIRPEIAADAWVAPGAMIIGKVRLLPGANVWFGAVLRGDNEWIEVGAGTNIQENAVLHTDMGYPLTIGAGCTIGHKAMLHGCRIGDDSLIGMDATLLNGSTVGQGCLIGARALLTEGKAIPDRTLAMGVPAKAVRELDEAGLERLRASALHYQANAARFRAGLHPVSD
jgi:carbonic anhydrase/acetyltransferase-like protein (isoleucine patch superfamily)